MARGTKPTLRLHDELRPGVRHAHWIAQRVLWVLMLAAIVAALLGGLGTGWLSGATITSSGEGLDIELSYQRIARLKRPQRLTLVVQAPGQPPGTLALTLSHELASRIRVHAAIPDADSTALSPAGAVYEWTVDDWSRPVRVSIEYQAEYWRSLDAELLVQAGDGAARRVAFSQFVFP